MSQKTGVREKTFTTLSVTGNRFGGDYLCRVWDANTESSTDHSESGNVWHDTGELAL